MSRIAPHPLSPFGGEFMDREREAAFQAERLPETLRHIRLLFLLSAILNALFLISDWRFFGQPHFYAAVPARIVVVLIALACLWAAWRAKTFGEAERSMVAWEWINGAAVSVLVTSRSDLALFVVLMLPSIYYIVVPTSFRWTLVSGVGCSAMMLAGYLLPDTWHSTTIGLVLAVVMLNFALLLVVSRANRLQRTQWSATQAEKEAKEELADSRTMAETIFRTVPIPLLVVRMDGTIIEMNEAALRYVGATPETLGVENTKEFYVDPQDRNAFVAEIQKNGQVSNFESRLRLADGSIRTVLLAGSLLEVGGGGLIMAGVIDITDRKKAEERLWRAASHDPLTDLPNRAFFQSRMEQTLAHAERNGSDVSLILIDLDNLRAVNDKFGHDAGDALIQRFADSLSRIAQDNDMVARLGGDEFVVIVASSPASENAIRLAKELLIECRRPFLYGEDLLSCQASIGIAVYPEHDRQPAGLLKDADLALRAAKQGGGNRLAVYSPGLRADAHQEASTAHDILKALQQGLIVPFYQPKIDLASGKVVGFEALARWLHSDQGTLAPGAFPTAFEDPELAIAVGEHLIRQVASDVRRWLDLGIDCGRIAVNLSPPQFNWVGLAKRFLEIVHAAGVPNERLEVEVTETVFVSRSASHVISTLRQFHESGITIALDDFGTGYASLIHLKQFPIDVIKIDRSFITHVETDPSDAAIVQAVIQLGRGLGMTVIAEGVEDAGQVAFLREKGCAQIQGDLYGKPMEASQVPVYLGQRTDRIAREK